MKFLIKPILPEFAYFCDQIRLSFISRSLLSTLAIIDMGNIYSTICCRKLPDPSKSIARFRYKIITNLLGLIQFGDSTLNGFFGSNAPKILINSYPLTS